MQEKTVPTRWQGTVLQFLQHTYPTLPTGKWHQYLRENKIKVNGKKLPLTAPLTCGSTVKIFVPDEVLQKPKGPLYLQAKPYLELCYEDSHLLLVQKPAGIAVQDESGKTADTLLHRVWRFLHERDGAFGCDAFLPQLCHRLDTGTSGIVVLAKTPEALAQMLELIRLRQVQKTYLCVTFGHPKPAVATLHAHLRKNAQSATVQVLQNATAGTKPIVTAYKTLATSGRFALVEIDLITGRTHQIRAQMAAIGCPVLGDSKYGNNAINRAYKMKYQALCAHSLTFSMVNGACSGVSGKTFTAQTPWYVAQIYDRTLQ